MVKTCFLGEKYRFKALVLAVSGFWLLFLAGCGTNGGISVTGGSAEDQAAILEALETDPFFLASGTQTDEDEDAAAAQYVQPYNGQVPLQSLSAHSGTAELPRFWWRGNLERLSREVDIHIDGETADVTVVHDIAGTFFIADQVDGVMVLWGKPFEDLVTRHARFTKKPRGWVLSAISPVEFAAAGEAPQTVYIGALRAYAGDELVWEATAPSTLFTVTSGMPIFEHGEEIRVEAEVFNTAPSSWLPDLFVFLHRPGPQITGRRTRDIMFDDGTNGDIEAGDGIFTRLYTIGPCRGRHFAAVDVVDAGTFMELSAPYNSGAWGMPYIVE